MMPACRAGEVLLVKGIRWWEGLRPSATVHGDGHGNDSDGGDRVRGSGVGVIRGSRAVNSGSAGDGAGGRGVHGGGCDHDGCGDGGCGVEGDDDVGGGRGGGTVLVVMMVIMVWVILFKL